MASQLDQLFMQVACLQADNEKLKEEVFKSQEDAFYLRASLVTAEVEVKAQAKTEIENLQSQLSFKESEMQQIQRELTSMKRKMEILSKETAKSEPTKESAISTTTQPTSSVADASVTKHNHIFVSVHSLISLLPLLLKLSQRFSTIVSAAAQSSRGTPSARSSRRTPGSARQIGTTEPQIQRILSFYSTAIDQETTSATKTELIDLSNLIAVLSDVVDVYGACPSSSASEITVTSLDLLRGMLSVTSIREIQPCRDRISNGSASNGVNSTTENSVLAIESYLTSTVKALANVVASAVTQISDYEKVLESTWLLLEVIARIAIWHQLQTVLDVLVSLMWPTTEAPAPIVSIAAGDKVPPSVKIGALRVLTSMVQCQKIVTNVDEEMYYVLERVCANKRPENLDCQAQILTLLQTYFDFEVFCGSITADNADSTTKRPRVNNSTREAALKQILRWVITRLRDIIRRCDSSCDHVELIKRCMEAGVGVLVAIAAAAQKPFRVLCDEAGSGVVTQAEGVVLRIWSGRLHNDLRHLKTKVKPLLDATSI